jgi:hypothetical protein
MLAKHRPDIACGLVTQRPVHAGPGAAARSRSAGITVTRKGLLHGAAVRSLRTRAEALTFQDYSARVAHTMSPDVRRQYI